MEAKTNNKPQNSYSLANLLRYAINQSLLNVNTILIAKIVIVNSNNTFDVQPLINGLTVDRQAVQLPVIYEVPNTVIQGGSAGIIIHPQAGDIVVIGCCQRDISIFKNTLKQSNPNSLRKFSLSDSVILGCYPATPPSVFIDVAPTGINITSTQAVTVNATTATINANTVALGKGASDGVLTANSKINDSTGKPCVVITSSTTVKASN